MFSVNIANTGDYRRKINQPTLPFAEPYKLTTLVLEQNTTYTNTNTNTDCQDSNLNEVLQNKLWTVKIQFIPRDDEIWPDDQKDLLAKEIRGHTFRNIRLRLGSKAQIKFMLPGTYRIKIFRQTETGKLWLRFSDNFRVAYARRDVIDLSKADWDNYVDAIWTMKNLSSTEGQARFNCPHFYNIDVFTTMHGVHSYNTTCDQIHYGTMMGFAHQAWMTLFERSLQCVHPSIAMPYYNIIKDFAKYYDPERGLKSMLDSPIFGPEYYGGGHANWNNRSDIHDPYYVEDGRFAYFPLRQNRTGLCDESSGIFNDETYIPLCKSVMENGGFLGWQNSDPANTGLWMREPRDLSSYKYVSARRWYVYGSMAETSLKSMVPTRQEIFNIYRMNNAYSQLYNVDSYSIHGYAHIAFSGLWGGGMY